MLGSCLGSKKEMRDEFVGRGGMEGVRQRWAALHQCKAEWPQCGMVGQRMNRNRVRDTGAGYAPGMHEVCARG